MIALALKFPRITLAVGLVIGISVYGAVREHRGAEDVKLKLKQKTEETQEIVDDLENRLRNGDRSADDRLRNGDF